MDKNTLLYHSQRKKMNYDFVDAVLWRKRFLIEVIAVVSYIIFCTSLRDRRQALDEIKTTVIYLIIELKIQSNEILLYQLMRRPTENLTKDDGRGFSIIHRRKLLCDNTLYEW